MCPSDVPVFGEEPSGHRQTAVLLQTGREDLKGRMKVVEQKLEGGSSLLLSEAAG